MDSTIKDNIIKFAALLYNPRDVKNKNKWKHSKIIKNGDDTLIYVYGRPKNNLDISKFNEKCVIDLTNGYNDCDGDVGCKKINGGSVRIIINIISNTYKIAFVKKMSDEENLQMKYHDYAIYYESDENLIDTNDITYKKLKEICLNTNNWR
jgi:hypothetical protein